MLEKEQWDEWLVHPVTQKLRDWAKEEVGKVRDLWESGGLKGETEYLSQIQDSLAHGRCQILRQIEEMDYQQIIGDEQDVSPERVEDGPAGEPGY